jgi:excinuclease ABC subunit B
LRSPRSLIQTIGRAARNAEGRVIMYADRITAAMRHAIDETDRRREVQRAYNVTHGITPETVVRAILDVVTQSGERDYYAVPNSRKAGDAAERGQKGRGAALDDHELMERIQALRQEMFLAAENLQFEKAARLRDELKKLQGDRGQGGSGEVVPMSAARASSGSSSRRASGSGKRAARTSGSKKPPPRRGGSRG